MSIELSEQEQLRRQSLAALRELGIEAGHRIKCGKEQDRKVVCVEFFCQKPGKGEAAQTDFENDHVAHKFD